MFWDRGVAIMYRISHLVLAKKKGTVEYFEPYKC